MRRYYADGFLGFLGIVGFVAVKKIKSKVFLASMKTLTLIVPRNNCGNPLQKSCYGSKMEVILKIVLKRST